MASDLVPAIWRGPFDGLLPNLGRIEPGQEYQVTEGDLLSAHWEPVKAPKPVKATVQHRSAD